MKALDGAAQHTDLKREFQQEPGSRASERRKEIDLLPEEMFCESRADSSLPGAAGAAPAQLLPPGREELLPTAWPEQLSQYSH